MPRFKTAAFLIVNFSLIASGNLHAQAPLVPDFWPCPDDGPLSKEAATLVNSMIPELHETDRRFGMPQGTSHAMYDEAACQATHNPKIAASIAHAWGYPEGWERPAAKQAAAVAALAISEREHQVAGQTPSNPTPSNPWYSYNQNKTECFQSGSPADRIIEIKGNDHDFTTKDYGSPSSPYKVEIAEGLGNGTERVFTYWRSIKQCEADISESQIVDPRYR